jgi:amino acid adenylation domain-containing protein
VNPIKFKVCEVSEEDDIEARCNEVYHDLFNDAIDPFTFPLFKGAVLHLPNGMGSRFYYCVSLFIMDGITDLSWRSHISKRYRGEEVPAAPVLTYKAYNEGYLNEETGIYKCAKWRAAKDYWMAKIEAGLPLPPQVPLLKEAPTNTGKFSDKGTNILSAEELRILKDAAAQLNVTPTAVLLMLYCVALARHATSDQMLINVLQCLRHPVHEDCERVLGNFSSSFLCPIDASCCSSRRSLSSLARAVMDTLMECQMNNTISGVDVMSLINTRQSALGKAAAPYVFVSALGVEAPEWRSLCFREAKARLSTSGAYMDHAIKENPDGSMVSSFNVLDGAFESHISESIAQVQIRLLKAITTNTVWDLCPDDILGTLPVPASLGEPPVFDASDTLERPLVEQANCTPDAIAIVDVGQSVKLSYLSLYKQALSVSTALVECGAPDGIARYGASLVAVVCQKSWQQIVAVLGILLAGCAYLPVNVLAWPRARIEVVLEVGEVTAILSSSITLSNLSWLTELQKPVINVDAERSETCTSCSLPPARSSDTLAYCIFTSGSTGKPKGVAMAHNGALNTIKALIDMHQLDAKTVTLGLSHLSFDLSVSDIFLTLRVGGTLVIPPESTLSPPSPSEWRKICLEYGVSLWNSVPALFGLFCEATKHEGKDIPSSLGLVWLSGDVIPADIPASAQLLSSHSLGIHAMGGATEAGIWSNSADISQHLPSDGLVPYGNALPGQSMHVVRTEDLAIASVGVDGMLVISGSSLMMGYYNDAETTSKALVDVNGERLYLTRDAGYMRRRSDGSLENMITGRIHDDQLGYVKIRGFRVELQEVEAALRSQSAVKAALVNAFDGDLVAYVVLHDAGNNSTNKFTLEQELRHAMRNVLPVYALPKWFQVMDDFPLSANGKIDRASLPIPAKVEADDASTAASSSGPRISCGSSVTSSSGPRISCGSTSTSSLGHCDDIATNEFEMSVMAAANEVGIAVQSQSDDILLLGADSVKILRLIFKLEERHSVKLDVGMVFTDGRISAIAGCLQAATGGIDSTNYLSLSRLAESSTLHDESSTTLCFLCHGAGTTSLALSALAVELAKLTANTQIYGISDSFLSSTAADLPYSSIEEVANDMAALVVDHVNASSSACANSDLNIVLGGWSYGGVVAFACARLLLAKGMHVKQLIMLDAPLGQSEGSQLDDETQRQLAASASSTIAGRVAHHFEACNNLLAKYEVGESQLSTSVLDIRPETSKVDFLSSDIHESLAASWQRIVVDEANHFTLVQHPLVEQVARHCTSCMTNSWNEDASGC